MLNQTEKLERLQQRVKDLEITLGQSNDNLAVTFKLTPVLNNLMGLLLALPNVTPEMIRQRLEIAPDAKVAKHRLSKHLDALYAAGGIPFEVKIQSRRNLGYWIEDETKLRIRQLLAEKQRAAQAAEAMLAAKDTPAGNDYADEAGPEDDAAAA